MLDTLASPASSIPTTIDAEVMDLTVFPVAEITVKAAEFAAMLKASAISRSSDATLPVLCCSALQFSRQGEPNSVGEESPRIRVAATDRFTLLITELSSVSMRSHSPKGRRAGLRTLWDHATPVVLLADVETDDIIRFLSRVRPNVEVELSLFAGKPDGTSTSTFTGRLRVKIVGTSKALEVPTFHDGEFPSIAKLVPTEFVDGEVPAKFGLNAKFLARVPKIAALLVHVESAKSKFEAVSGRASTVVLQQNKNMTSVSPQSQPDIENVDGTVIDWNMLLMHVRLPH